MIPTSTKLINMPAGAPTCNEFPDDTRRPGPMIPRILVRHGVIVREYEYGYGMSTDG